ncbi:MAG TPA: sce7726 family protein [Pyrinomonadaceae bacterium]|nr:sce7726 family protein [Pyrinomonadaceae bacterium]
MNDQQLRRAVKKKVLAHYAKHPDTRIVDELGLRHGIARVDIAVVNGIIHGYELKSNKDNLKRLPHQIQVYGSVLDKVTLVVGIRHANEATKLVPDWWGIKIATVGSRGAFEFESYRTARTNPSLDPLSVCKLLWRDEALTLLAELGEAEGVRHKPRAIVYSRLSQVAELGHLQERVRRQLKSRTNWRSVE